MIAKLKAFILGMWEFRCGVTTHYDDPLINTYDYGRELAHKITRRRWDDCWEG